MKKSLKEKLEDRMFRKLVGVGLIFCSIFVILIPIIPAIVLATVGIYYLTDFDIKNKKIKKKVLNK